MLFLKREEGTILGIAMVYFLIFSLMGLAVLTLAAHCHHNVLDEVHALKNRYVVESMVNLALWRINQGPDSLADFTMNGVTSQFIDSTMMLIVSTSQWWKPYNVSVELKFDDAFHNPISVTGSIDTSNITMPHGFEFQTVDSIPQIDLNYYYQHADSIYYGNQSFEDTWDPGIHYIDSGTVTLRNNFHLLGTLVVIKDLKVVGTNVLIQAGQDSSGTYLPALIVGDSVSSTSITDITIEGAIYSLGALNINKGLLTGPIISTNLVVQNSLTIDSTGAEQYYSYPPGFDIPAISSINKSMITGTWRN